jgi:hypothetical protein
VLTVFSVRLRVEAGETDVELIIQHVAIPWLRPLVDGLSLRWPGFDPITVHVTFLLDKLALGQVYEHFGFPLSASFHQCSIFIFMYTLLLKEGLTGEVWEPNKKQCSAGNREELDRKILSV